ASVYSTPASSHEIRITQPSGRALAASGPPLRCQYHATVMKTLDKDSRISVGMAAARAPGSLRRRVPDIEVVGGVQHAHRQLGLILVDQHADLDFAGGDRLNVDAAIGQRAEHRRRDARMAAHA